jgi:LysR family transcriptional regulator, pca operon transcriptional activator
MDRRIKLRHLECLLQAAQHRYLSEVAQALHVTPAAVSKTLTELEEIVGHPLLTRGRAGLQLNAAAERMVRHLSVGWGAIEKALTKTDSRPFEPTIELRIGVLPAVAARFMPPAISQLLQAYPSSVNIALQTGYNRPLLELLHRGKLVLVVARVGDDELMRELEFTPLYAEPLILVARAGHPLFAQSRTSDRIRAMASYPFLLPPPQTSIRSIVQAALQDLNAPTPHTMIETVSNTFGRAFVSTTDALWMISRGVVEDHLQLGSMRMVLDPMPNTGDPVGLVRRTDQEVDPITRSLSQILVSQTEHLRAESQAVHTR